MPDRCRAACVELHVYEVGPAYGIRILQISALSVYAALSSRTTWTWGFRHRPTWGQHGLSASAFAVCDLRRYTSVICFAFALRRDFVLISLPSLRPVDTAINLTGAVAEGMWWQLV